MSDPLQFAAFLALLREAKVPSPVLELKFTPDRRWRFDCAWPERMVAVECEGGVWTMGRHNRPSGFIRDCEKYNKAAELGWRVLRYPRQQLTHKATIEQIRSVVNGTLNAGECLRKTDEWLNQKTPTLCPTTTLTK